MPPNLDKWLKPEEKPNSEQKKSTHFEDLIDFSKEEIQRFLNPDFVAKINLGELGIMLLEQLKKETIKKSLKRDIEKRKDKIKFLKEMEKQIKESIEDCKDDSRIKNKKIKLIKKLLLEFVEKEKGLEEDMDKPGYEDPFLRPFG